MAAPVEAQVDAATAAAQRGDWRECLQLLVTAWRPQREPELAAIIERVSERVVAPTCASSKRSVTARIASATVCDVDPILATIGREIRTNLRFLDSLLALATTIGPDPRVAKLLAETCHALPLDELVYAPGAPLEVLDTIDDPRFRGIITSIVGEIAEERYPTRRAQVKRLRGLAKAIRQRPAPPNVPPTEIAAIVKALRPVVDLTPLLEAIYANPDDTAARLVYADALQERGDPRGAVIALQCAGITSARTSADLRVHTREWLGTLEPHLKKRDVVYRRGFVAAGVLAHPFDEAPVDPAWHTLEELDLEHAFDYEGVLPSWLQRLRGLRRVARLYQSDFLRLDRPVRWRSLGMRHITREFGPAFANHAALLPELEELDLSHCEDDPVRWLSGDMSNLRLRLSTTSGADVERVRERAQSLGFDEIVLVAGYRFQLKASRSEHRAGSSRT